MTYRGLLFLTINCDSAWGSRDGVSEVSFVLGVGVGDFFFRCRFWGERKLGSGYGFWLGFVIFFRWRDRANGKGERRFVGEVRTLHGLGPCSWYPIASSMLLACLFFLFSGLCIFGVGGAGSLHVLVSPPFQPLSSLHPPYHLAFLILEMTDLCSWTF